MDLDALARSAGGIVLEDVPAEVRAHAIRTIADTVGVAIGGAKMPEIGALIRGDDPLFPVPPAGPAHLLSPGFPRADPVVAAFINGTAGTFLEMDEGYRPTGHPAMHVVPAALAAAEALHRTGWEFVAAFLSGYEITARLFEAYRLRYPMHPHGHFGAVGAAVAVARLRGVDAAEPAAIAATLPILSVWPACMEGATARNAYTGAGSALGLTANRLALAGFRGSRLAYDASFGTLVGDLAYPEALTDPVTPDTLRITRNYLKFHSACALNHSALDAVLSLAPDADRVQRVEVETVTNNMKIAPPARANNLSTRFSLPYAVAAAIVHGHTGPQAFEPDARVADLQQRVEVRAAPDLEAAWPDSAPARVTVYLEGETRSARVDNPRGHHANPVTPADVRAKFEMLAGGTEAGALYDRLLAVMDVPDMAEVFAAPVATTRP